MISLIESWFFSTSLSPRSAATTTGAFALGSMSFNPLLRWPTIAYLWMLQFFSHTAPVVDDVATPPSLSPSEKVPSEIKQNDVVYAIGHCSVATTVGIGAATCGNLRNLLAARKSSRRLAPVVPGEGGHTETATKFTFLRMVPYGLATSSRSNASRKLEKSPTHDTASSLESPLNDDVADTFFFAGLHTGTLEDPQLAELARVHGATWSTWDDAAVDILGLDVSSEEGSDRSVSPIMDLEDFTEENSDRSASPPAIFDVEEMSFLDLSDSSSCTSAASDEEVFACSSGSSGRAVYSSCDVQTIVRSCISESWSGVDCCAGSIKSSVRGWLGFRAKDGNSSASVDSPYIAGCEPDEPVKLQHDNKTYLIRFRQGQGSFGRVYMANDYQGRVCALKVVHKDKQYRAQDGRQGLILEQRVLEKVAALKKPFLTPLLDSWADAENVYFVMPFYHRTLHELIHYRRISSGELKLYIAELVSGLSSLHKAGIIHRDLKSENILIDAEGHLAIGDFGLAVLLDKDQREKLDKVFLRGTIGTVGMMAPEVYGSDHPAMRREHRSGKYNYKCDIWSLAAVILEMALGQHFVFMEFSDHHEPKLDYDRKMDYEKIRDDNLTELLQSMLEFNYRKRPNTDEVKKSAYLADVDWPALESRTWAAAASVLSPPRFPRRREGSRGATLRFMSFHNGLDSTMNPSERPVDENHYLIPTPWVAYQHLQDEEDPLAYECVVPSF